VLEKKKYNLTVQAEEDIKEIWHYSVDRWGEELAEKYSEQLEHRFEWLVENTHLGKERDEVKEGYKSYFQGKHTIFYRITSVGIEVIGIPHQSEDIERHFEIDNFDTPYKNLLDQFDKPDEEPKPTSGEAPQQANDDLEL